VENNLSNNETLTHNNQIFPPRKVWMKTYGCQMNEHDTQRILSSLENLNFSRTNNQADADLVLFNTCAIRDLSNMKFYSHLGETKKLKSKDKKVIIGVGGCVAQTEGKELIKKYSQLDFAFGTDVIDQVPDMVYRTYAGDNKFAINSWDRSEDYSIETKIVHGEPRAFVNIIKGCNKYCSYCIVPYTRGKERSRKTQEVVEDVKRLVEYQGIQEVTLLGQNVNSFGHDNQEKFSNLLRKLDQINGLGLIRYTTSHPYDVDDDLIEVHGQAKKLSHHLHLPVQSGSNTVLERMLREYTVEHFLGLMEKLRKAQPKIVISSDIIAGFPNETQSEHEDTLKLLKNAQFDFIYSYAFSKRNKTRAASIEDSLTNDTRGERLREIQALQLNIQAGIRSKLVGTELVMLVEDSGTMKGEFKFKGRTNCMRIVHFKPEDPTKDYKWHWVKVKITSTTALSCQGVLLEDYGKSFPFHL